MEQISKSVIEHFMIRKTKKQKDNFIYFLEKAFKIRNIHIKVDEQGKLPRNKNIIVGDVEKADVILTAHYDTCARMFIPNFIAPKNLIVTLLYQLLISFVIIFIGVFAMISVDSLTANPFVGLLAFLIVIYGIFAVMIFGKANKNNFNDNTSGVITLIEIMLGLSDEQRKKVAFVFFDNEELGLVGSSCFKKKYKSVVKDKLLINFDCVSDGDHFMVGLNKNLRKDSAMVSKLKEAFAQCENKKKSVMFISSAKILYPSDQMFFKKGACVAAFKKAPIVGLYVDKIHTKKDVNFDETNIFYLKSTMQGYIAKL